MEDSKRIFTEVIKRQMAILGPDITLAKVKNVSGIVIDPSGQVIKIEGDPKALLSELINQFVELSGLIVKKTMESILMSNPAGLSIVGEQIANGGGISPQINQPISNQSQPVPPMGGQVMQKETDSNIASANHDIEELNKMLNNLSNPAKQGS